MSDTISGKARGRWVGAAASLLTFLLASLLALLAPAVGASPAGQATLLVLGDSLSAEYGLPRGTGWVALLERRLAERHPAWRVVNASISGETTAGGATRIGGLMARHRPALVIVELGGNDALRGLDLKASRRNLDQIVTTASQHGARVLLLGMQVPPNYGKAYTDAFARLFHEVAEAHALPLEPFFLAAFAEDPGFFQPDRIHPDVRAQPLMLDAVWPILERLLGASDGRPPGVPDGPGPRG